jgi:hypothetical protein
MPRAVAQQPFCPAFSSQHQHLPVLAAQPGIGPAPQSTMMMMRIARSVVRRGNRGREKAHHVHHGRSRTARAFCGGARGQPCPESGRRGGISTSNRPWPASAPSCAPHSVRLGTTRTWPTGVTGAWSPAPAAALALGPPRVDVKRADSPSRPKTASATGENSRIAPFFGRTLTPRGRPHCRRPARFASPRTLRGQQAGGQVALAERGAATKHHRRASGQLRAREASRGSLVGAGNDWSAPDPYQGVRASPRSGLSGLRETKLRSAPAALPGEAAALGSAI